MPAVKGPPSPAEDRYSETKITQGLGGGKLAGDGGPWGWWVIIIPAALTCPSPSFARPGIVVLSWLRAELGYVYFWLLCELVAC